MFAFCLHEKKGLFFTFWPVLGKFLVPIKLGKIGEKVEFFVELGKIIVKFLPNSGNHLLNCDFFTKLDIELFRSIGNFFSPVERNLVPKTVPSFVQRKSPKKTKGQHVIHYVLECGNHTADQYGSISVFRT